MIRLTAELNSNLAAMAGKQLPFITSVALNRTAVGARDIVRGNLPKKFKLRNNWTRGGVQARMSSKTALMAQVVAPGYMGIQETGGDRSPATGRALAAPAPAMQSSTVIPRGRRPRGVLADKAFLIHMPDGDAGIFIRYGRGRGQIKLLWWLTDQQDYDRRFHFEGDVYDYVHERFPMHFAAAFADAVKTGDYATTTSRGRKRNARPEGMSARAWRRQQSKAGR